MRPEGEDRSQEGIDIEDLLNNAISEVFQSYNQAMVTKFVLIAEVLQADGSEQEMWTFTSPGARRWDIKGMMQDAIDFQIAYRMVEIIEAHREEGC